MSVKRGVEWAFVNTLVSVVIIRAHDLTSARVQNLMRLEAKIDCIVSSNKKNQSPF